MHSYELIRARRKSVQLRITDGLTLQVRAPLRLPRVQVDAWVEEMGPRIEEMLQAKRAHLIKNPPPTEAEIARLRKLAKAYLPGRVEYFARLMGLYPKQVKINAARKRYGSCSSANNLNFSCLLMRCPPEAIDYVVVHELAHIRHKNHGPEFYALIERYLPDYRARRKLLAGA